MMVKSVNIGVMGTGNVGRAITSHLYSQIDFIREYLDTTINHLYIIGRDRNKYQSVAQQAVKSKDGLVFKTRIRPWDIKNLDQIVDRLDITIITADANPGHSTIESTLDLCPENIEKITKAYGPLFENNSGTKIVVTNLTDIITHSFIEQSNSRYLDQIQTWVGMNHIDTKRFRDYVAAHIIGNDLIGEGLEGNIVGGFAIGPHNNPYCLFNDLWTYRNKVLRRDDRGPRLSVYFLTEDNMKRPEALRIGNEVRTEAGRHMVSVGDTTNSTVPAIFEMVLAIIDEQSKVSASTFYKLNGENRGIMIGLPVRFKDYKAIVDFDFDRLTEQDEKEFIDRIGILRQSLSKLYEEGLLKNDLIRYEIRSDSGEAHETELKLSISPKKSQPIQDQAMLRTYLIASTTEQHEVMVWDVENPNEHSSMPVKMQNEKRSVFDLTAKKFKNSTYIFAGTKNGIYAVNRDYRADVRQFLIRNPEQDKGVITSIDAIDDLIFGAHSRRDLNPEPKLSGHGLYMWSFRKGGFGKLAYDRPAMKIAARKKDLYLISDENILKLGKDMKVKKAHSHDYFINSLFVGDDFVLIGDYNGFLAGAGTDDLKFSGNGDMIANGYPITSINVDDISGRRFVFVGDEQGYLICYAPKRNSMSSGKVLFRHFIGSQEKDWDKTDITGSRVIYRDKEPRILVSFSDNIQEYSFSDMINLNGNTEMLFSLKKSYNGIKDQVYAMEVLR